MSRITKAQLIEENNSLGNQLKDKDLIYVNQFKEISRLKKENGSLIDKMKSTIERKNKTIIGLQKELVRRNQTLKKELETILNNQNTIKNNLIQENKVLNHNCENLHRQNIDFFQLNNKLLQENEKLNSDNIELFNKNINNHLSKVEETNLNGHDIFWYKEQLESVIATRDTYKSEIDRLKDENNHLERHIEAVLKECKHLESRIESLKQNKEIIDNHKKISDSHEYSVSYNKDFIVKINSENTTQTDQKLIDKIVKQGEEISKLKSCYSFRESEKITVLKHQNKGLNSVINVLSNTINEISEKHEQLKNRNFIQRLFNL